MPRSTQWGVRVLYQDGRSTLIGPFPSREAANANRPSGNQVVSSHAVRFREPKTGPPRVLASVIVGHGGLPQPEVLVPEILSVTYTLANDDVTIEGVNFDMNDVAEIAWEGNSSIPPMEGNEVSGTLTIPGVDWTVTDSDTLVVPSDTVAGLGSGSFNSLILYNGLAEVLASWTGYEEFT